MAQSHPQKPAVNKPQMLIVNSYTLVAGTYCIGSTFLFYLIVKNRYLGLVHLIAAVGVISNYLLLRATLNYKRASHIILSMGTFVVVSLFATGGWNGTGYLWPFAYLPYAYFLADKTTSRIWVGILLGLDIVLLILHIFGAITIPYSPVALGNYSAALAIFVLCMFLYQNSYLKNEAVADSKNRELEELNRSLVEEAAVRKENERILRQQKDELAKLNQLMVGRELKMVELKKQLSKEERS